jgi:UDP:flavonoid glycosyltransferase YjiC (YdhE family)
MRVVFSSLPAYGHLYPLIPLATACAEAGHEVTIATGQPFAGRVPFPTVLCVSEGTGFEMFEAEAARRNPDPADPGSFPATLFGDVCASHTAANLIDVFSKDRPDLVVYEVSNVGAAVAADVLGIPAVAFGLGLWNPFLARWHDTAAAVQSHRWETPPSLLGDYLDPMPPSLRSSPATRIPIRSVPWSESQGVPEWLAQPSSRPRVYITLGTVVYGMVEVLRRAITETVEHDVEVIVAVGPEGDPGALGAMPANVHVERFVSQSDVMRHVDLVVHHGGAGTMLGALVNGLPQLILPQGADQFFNAAAIKRVRAGNALLNDEQAPGAIRATVGDLLTDGPERLNAKRLQEEIVEMPAPEDVAGTLVAISRRC